MRQFGQIHVNVRASPAAHSAKKLSRKEKLLMWRKQREAKTSTKLGKRQLGSSGGKKYDPKRRRVDNNGKKKKPSKTGKKLVVAPQHPVKASKINVLCDTSKPVDLDSNAKFTPKASLKSFSFSTGNSKLSSIQQRLSALKESALKQRATPSMSKREAQEELQRSLRKWQKDREIATNSIRKTSASIRHLREEDEKRQAAAKEARLKAAERVKRAKQTKKCKKNKSSSTENQRMPMLRKKIAKNGQKQINRTRMAYNKEDRKLKMKHAFLVYSSEMEEIKQLINMNLDDQATAQLETILSNPQFSVLKRKALYYILLASVYEGLKNFKAAEECFSSGLRQVIKEVATLRAAYKKFVQRRDSQQEEDKVNQLLEEDKHSPIVEEVGDSVVKKLTYQQNSPSPTSPSRSQVLLNQGLFDTDEEDMFEEIAPPSLHASTATMKNDLDSLLTNNNDDIQSDPLNTEEIEPARSMDTKMIQDAGEDIENDSPPKGSTVVMGKVRATPKESETMGTTFFMSPVRRSMRKMRRNKSSEKDVLKEMSYCYKPNAALDGSLHLDGMNKEQRKKKSSRGIKAGFQSLMPVALTDTMLDEMDFVAKQSPLRMPQFPGIDMGLGSYFVQEAQTKKGTSTPLRRSRRIANTPK